MTTPPATLAAYTDGELGAYYMASADDVTPGMEAWRRLIEAELDSRDPAASAPRPAYAQAERAEWHDAAHAQYLQAERECRGELLNKRGEDAGIDPWSLWSGPLHRVDIYASEELREFFRRERRITVTEYQRQAAAGRAAEREARDDAAVVTHDTREVQPAAARDADRNAADNPVRAGGEQASGPDGDAGPARPARAGREAGDMIGEAFTRAAERAVIDGTRTTGGRQGYGTTPQPDPVAAARARLDARRAEIARQQAARATLPGSALERAQAAAGSTGNAAAATVALRSGGHVVRQDRERIDGAETLAYARKFLEHFAVWPSEAALTMCTLWAAHTWARDASKTLVFLSTPRLLFSSAEPGSGKSHAMLLVSRLCPDAKLFTEPSEPSVAHAVGAHCTICLDEVDILFGNGNRKAAIRALINDGYTPDGTWPRVRNGVVHEMPTFGPLMLAGLDKVEHGTSGTMAATLSRCLRARMLKAPADWIAPRFDRQARFAGKVIGERLGMFATQELEQIAVHVPDMDGIGLRDAQLWEPLFIMADVAGGDWPQLIRDAADELITTGGMAAQQDDDKLDRLDDIIAGWGAEE